MSSSLPNSHEIDWPAEMDRHEASLRRVLHHRLGKADAVDDVFQEIASAALHQRSRPTDPGKVSPWLHGVAIRQVADYLRRKGRQERLLENYADQAVAEGQSEPSPRDWLLRSELTETLTSAFRSLPEEQQEILNLKYMDRRRYKELAEYYGTTVKSVEHRLLQARQALRYQLAQRKLTEWTP